MISSRKFNFLVNSTLLVKASDTQKKKSSANKVLSNKGSNNINSTMNSTVNLNTSTLFKGDLNFSSIMNSDDSSEQRNTMNVNQLNPNKNNKLLVPVAASEGTANPNTKSANNTNTNNNKPIEVVRTTVKSGNKNTLEIF